jgi:cation diffusion facilitator family transporter
VAQTSSKPVIVAVAVGVVLAAAKFAAAAVTGSTSMLAEGIHSTVDAANDSLLLLGRYRSRRPPDPKQPFGHGKELYFWSTVVALVILGAGGGVTFFEGVQRLLAPEPIESPEWNYAILGLAAAFEGYSCHVALKEFRRERGDRGYWQGLTASKDPSTATVLLEDIAALAGVLVAFAGVTLNQVLGSPYPDALASLGIGLILAAIAVFLARESRNLLVGERADPELVASIRKLIEEDREVELVADPLTMHLGPSEVLLNLEIQFRDQLSTTELEAAIERLESAIRSKHPEVSRIFLETRSLTGGGKEPTREPAGMHGLVGA